MLLKIPAYPEDLPVEANDSWPDLARWPDPDDVTRFVSTTRNRPAIRLAVLTGLRRFSETNLNPLWAWISAWVALLGISISAIASVQWVQILAVVLVVVSGMILTSKLVDANGRLEERRKSALAWLQAFEDGIMNDRKKWWSR